MRTITIFALLISGQASAWPWTTVDDCVEKYVPKTESNQGAKIVRNACVSKYQNKSPNDGLFDCIMDKVPSAKTDTAATMLVNLCRKENPTRTISNADYWDGFEEFKNKTQSPPTYDDVDNEIYCRYTNGGSTP